MFRGSVKGTSYPLHSPVSPSLPLLCVTVCHHNLTGLYIHLLLSFRPVLKQVQRSSQWNQNCWYRSWHLNRELLNTRRVTRWHLKFTQRYWWRVKSSGVLRHVVRYVHTDMSKALRSFLMSVDISQHGGTSLKTNFPIGLSRTWDPKQLVHEYKRAVTAAL